MLQLLALMIGVVGGFAASRLLRRPDRAAQVSSVARNVGSSVARQRKLDLPELQRACYSDMVRHVTVDRNGRGAVPASFRIHLNPGDLARIDEARRWFTEGLIEALMTGAADRGWTIDGPVQVSYETDPGRHPGAPRAVPTTKTPSPPAASVPVIPVPRGLGKRPAPEVAPPVAPSNGTGELSVIRIDTGERFVMRSSPVTIGRSLDRTITIDDDRVSRSHALIESRDGGWWIADAGSGNGTRLGKDKVRPGHPKALRAGDMIAVGPVHLRVVPSAEGGGAGTSPARLADHTRTSGEVIPRFREITGNVPQARQRRPR